MRINNLHKRYRLNERLVKKIVLQTLKYCKIGERTELEFIFLGDDAIKKINKKYKNSGRATDVLSFYIDRKEFGLDPLGEIFISVDAAFRQSKIFGTNIGDEIALYVIHGILHLFGYDDLDAASRKKMFRKQEEVLAYLWKREDLSKVLTPR